MAPSSSSCLSAAAPLFVPQTPIVPHPAAPVFVTYVPPPLDLQPPMGLPSPFMGPPPPPVFGSPFQGLPPPPGYTWPVQGPPPPPRFPIPFPGPPPPPGFPVTTSPLWGFSHGPAMVLPHDIMVRSAVPLTAAPKVGDKAPAGSARSWRATSGTWRPKPLSPQIHRAAKQAPAIGSVATGDGSHAAAKGDGPSPRSVLAAATTSPPGSPRALPAGFPYPTPTPSSLPPAKLASWRGARPACQRPRLRFNPTCGLTTLMIRNIPNGFARQKVMNIIDQHCAEVNAKIVLGGGGVKSEYDFIYVPFDFKSSANKGYCFVNVTSPDAALRLWKYLHGFRWKVNDSRKICEVDYATIQGRETLVAHFSQSRFDCDNEEFLPVWFSPPRDGTRPAVVERHVVGSVGRRS